MFGHVVFEVERDRPLGVVILDRPQARGGGYFFSPPISAVQYILGGNE